MGLTVSGLGGGRLAVGGDGIALAEFLAKPVKHLVKE